MVGMTPIAKVWVDEPACAANRACMLLETHVFVEQVDDYVPGIAEDAAKYFETRRRQRIESVLSCPVSAICLQFADGTVISSDHYDNAKGVEEWINY